MHQRVPQKPTRQLIALIGMPAAGKTKVGKLLAGHLRCNFVDTDVALVRRYGAKNLQEVVDDLSPVAFAQAEENVVIETVDNALVTTIIATGGSVCYSKRAMEHLARHTHLIHLWAPRDIIIRRVEQDQPRGLVLAPGETLGDLYDRRMPLYCRWAHRTVDTGSARAKWSKWLARRLVKEGHITGSPTPSR